MTVARVEDDADCHAKAPARRSRRAAGRGFVVVNEG